MSRALALLASAASILAGASAGEQTGPAVPRNDHVVLIVLENKEANKIFGRREAPSFNRLARQGATLTRYYGVAHPSLPNYLALVSGSTHGITSDCTNCLVSGASLADTLEAHGKTWKTYAEGLPKRGFTGASSGRYVKRHDPLVYFRRLISRPERLQHIVPLTQFGEDRAGSLPNFSLVVPDLCHDMHDCSIATGDRWLGRFVRPLLRSTQQPLVLIVFDEGSSAAGGGGHVAAIALGPVRPGSRSDVRLSHYSLLRTIEEALRVPLLGRSRSAPAIGGIWLPGAQSSSAGSGSNRLAFHARCGRARVLGGIGGPALNERSWRCWLHSPRRSTRARTCMATRVAWCGSRSF